MLKENKFKVIISSIVILLPILFGLIMWNELPNTMTTHWGADGNADGFGTKPFPVTPAFLRCIQCYSFELYVTPYSRSHHPVCESRAGSRRFFKFSQMLNVLETVSNALPAIFRSIPITPHFFRPRCRTNNTTAPPDSTPIIIPLAKSVQFIFILSASLFAVFNVSFP